MMGAPIEADRSREVTVRRKWTTLCRHQLAHRWSGIGSLVTCTNVSFDPKVGPPGRYVLALVQ